MNREQACNYLRSSGFSEEQIRTIEDAFTCEDAILEIEKLSPVTPQPICEEREKGECPYYAG